MAGPTGRYDSTILNSLRIGRGKGKFNKLREREAEFEDYTRQRDPADVEDQREQYERDKPERMEPSDDQRYAASDDDEVTKELLRTLDEPVIKDMSPEAKRNRQINKLKRNSGR